VSPKVVARASSLLTLREGPPRPHPRAAPGSRQDACATTKSRPRPHVGPLSRIFHGRPQAAREKCSAARPCVYEMRISRKHAVGITQLVTMPTSPTTSPSCVNVRRVFVRNPGYPPTTYVRILGKRVELHRRSPRRSIRTESARSRLTASGRGQWTWLSPALVATK
jgi:hypothetical protein